jgi:hypothetical protein
LCSKAANFSHEGSSGGVYPRLSGGGRTPDTELHQRLLISARKAYNYRIIEAERMKGKTENLRGNYELI